MKKKVPVFVLVLACVLCMAAGGLVTLGVLHHAVGEDGMALLQAQVLIRNRFVGEYDPDLVRQAAERALVEELGDRWSSYLTPEEYRQTVQTRDNNYVGVGITIQEAEEGLQVISVARDGPAEEAGITAGDVICAVDGVPVTPENREASIQRIRGEAGTTVTLDLLSETGERRSVTVTRDQVLVRSADWKMLEGDTALLTIENFYTGAASQVSACLDEMAEEGAGALVIDLRFNPGGYVTEMTRVLDLLLPEGDIFRMEYYNGRERVYRSDEDSIGLPMAVLVNENTYSAAELMAAQIRETTGGPVVGTRTSGKGYSQNLFPLRDGSAINLSCARYFTGGGTSLIGTGLVPDPYVGLSIARQWDLLMGQLAPEDDGQLQAALRALDGRPDT